MVRTLLERVNRQQCPRCETQMVVESVGAAYVVYVCPACTHSRWVMSTPELLF